MKKGFTLVELIIAIAMLMIFVVVLIQFVGFIHYMDGPKLKYLMQEIFYQRRY